VRNLIIYTLHSPNIIRVNKQRRMRWVGHAAHMRSMRIEYKILLEIPEGKNHLGDLGIDGKIILKLIFGK
jgi:hypothetical protein